MKKVFSARTELEAHEVRLFLESQGIRAMVDGGSTAFTNLSFTPDSEPSVLVDDNDVETASGLVARFLGRPRTSILGAKWTCCQCGEIIEAQFDACWKCGALRSESEGSSADGGNESAIINSPSIEPLPDDVMLMSSSESALALSDRREAWLEVGVVLAVVWLPYFSYSLLTLVWPAADHDWSYIADSLWQSVNFIATSVVVLYVIYRGQMPWHFYGIRRPRYVRDIVSGCVIWLFSMMAVSFVVICGATLSGAADPVAWGDSRYQFASPMTPIELLALVLLSLTIGFCEELSMRGYLIPQFERLLGSTAKSVLASTTLFASYHLYQGVPATAVIFVIGLVYAGAFCWLRRLWPVAIAHALTDLISLSAAN